MLVWNPSAGMSNQRAHGYMELLVPPAATRCAVCAWLSGPRPRTRQCELPSTNQRGCRLLFHWPAEGDTKDDRPTGPCWMSEQT
jgi:hypothetical protein